MNFSELFIRRPVLTIVVSLLVLLLGAQGFINMSIREYPEVEETVITVTTTYPGAGAELMQGFITTPVAKAVATADGVDYVTSKSSLGSSTVTVNMRLNADPDQALVDVIAKVQQVRGQLPTDAEDPIIQKGTGQTFALMYLAVRSSTMNPQQVTEYISRVVQSRFSTIEGVGEVQILGGREFAMRIWLDPLKMAARSVTASDVLSAIRASNFLSAPGKTQNEFVAYTIETATTLQTPEAMGQLPVRSEGAEVVRLGDVARVEFGPESEDVKVSFNGEQGIFLGISGGPEANPLDVSSAVRAELPQIQRELPPGMALDLVYDATESIQASIEEVFRTIGEAVVIVVLVILLFLGSFRSVLVPIVTIPLSLVGVCFVLWALDYSINTLTLLAMVLAIGLVVDDAIVVVENIHRHLERGEPPMQAAIVGMREIFGAVVAMTITLAAVYAPIGFVQGLTGSLFREFAFTLAGAVIISGFIAVTLSPMMSARLLPGHGAKVSRFQSFVDRRFESLSSWYGRRVSGSLDYRPVTLFIVLALFGTMIFLFLNTSSELAPEEDRGALFALITAPAYATSDYTEMYAEQMRTRTADIKEVDARFSVVGFGGSSSAFAAWVLKPWGERDRSQDEVKNQIQGIIDKVAGVQAFVFSPPSLPGSGGGMPIQYVIRSIGDASDVYAVAEQIKDRAMKSGRFIVVQNSLAFTLPQARVTIDRDRAAALGVSISEIGTTLNALVGGGSVSKFDRESRSYDVITQVPQHDRFNPENLGDYFVRSASGAMVPLSAVIRVETQAVATAIEQFNELNSATLSALPLPGVTTGDGLQALRDIASEVMPTGFFEDFAGQSRLEVTEGNSTLIAFGLAIVIIYLVLAAQFESFRDPLIIMMTVPLSIFGALVPLNLGLATLNIYTQVGLITLIGLITKHGILMVEFANQQRETGLTKREAIVAAARVRLRPILMTTAAIVLAVIPLLRAEGAGAAARFSMGLVIAAGMTIGTLFTLFVLPMFYTLIATRDAEATHILRGDAHLSPAE
ncbi:efflux RND transporter permease subunit [Propylenella binzhouense]|uniref:Multidrug efflux protein n=1 Tax=Propylenella binzhouense TaxID=2555902 RepID=A0A964T4A0_9HYPH|nr:efflux RND transporter permease subunit [Propylenella binzhouense]MYZ48203.1 multidrug efflux protein [Propylenella binzhouense]